MTAQTIIDMAFRRIGQTRPGYTTSAELYADALLEWQMLVDELNAERDTSYSKPDYIYPVVTTGLANPNIGPSQQFLIGPVFTFSATLTNGQATATVANTAGLIIGQKISGTGIPANAFLLAIAPNTSIRMSANATASGAQTVTVTPDFIGPRPEKLTAANWIYPSGSNSVRIKLAVLEQQEWKNIPVLNIPAINVTQSIYYDRQYPCGVLNCWPPVQAGSGSFELFDFGVLAAPSSLSQTVSYPPGYWSLFRFVLSDRLVPLATRQNMIIDQRDLARLRIQALTSRRRIENVNKPNPKLSNSATSVGGRGVRGNSGFDYYTGEPY